MSTPILLLLAVVVVPCVFSQPSSPLDAFLPPNTASFPSSLANLKNATPIDGAPSCAASCLELPACASFTLCFAQASAGNLTCTLSQRSAGYIAQAPTHWINCSSYLRLSPRNDTPAPRAVPWVAHAPPRRTVELLGGPMYDAFSWNAEFYLAVRDPEDMLYYFRQRASPGGLTPPSNSTCFGWDGWLHGSAAGAFLMGAGGTLQWAENPTLASNVAQIVTAMRALQDSHTGWVWAFNESDLGTDNYPDYVASWVTRGLLDADAAGQADALALARQSVSLFNNHSLLPWFLPANGGPSPTYERPSSGFDNTTRGGYGQPAGHMIYMQNQGMIKHSLMALSSAGTQSDVDILLSSAGYLEGWWIQALLAKDLFHAVWHRQFFSHNYEVTAWEALLDLYVLTGNTTYLTAVLNAREMLLDHWILPGGTIALNEMDYYPPDSLYIGGGKCCQGVNRTGASGSRTRGRRGSSSSSARHSHSHSHGTSTSTSTTGGGGDGYFHSPCEAHGRRRSLQQGQDKATPSSLGQGQGQGEGGVSQDDVPHSGYISPLARLRMDLYEDTAPPIASLPALPSPPQEGSTSSSSSSSSTSSSSSIISGGEDLPPIGELCGSVFWTLLHQRLHRLDPDNETYVGEMERSIFNVGLAAVGPMGSGGEGPNGTGIRYFAAQNVLKDKPSMRSTCCEGQGTRLFGALPGLLFSLSPPPSTAGSTGAGASASAGAAPAASPNTTVYIDLYAESSLRITLPGGDTAALAVHTQWPLASGVALELTVPGRGAPGLTLALRIPAWVLPGGGGSGGGGGGGVAVSVNGVPWPAPGVPGSYLKVGGGWVAGAINNVSFSLPMAITAHKYTGVSQVAGKTRWAFTYGPLLLSLFAPYSLWSNADFTFVIPDSIDPTMPIQWLTLNTTAGAPPLTFSVEGLPGVRLTPYYLVQPTGAPGAEDWFTNFAAFRGDNTTAASAHQGGAM